jgi:nucleotide-binding universal stress UspA family protein
LYLITGLQLLTIVASRGNVILLGEAYAFGVVWSFVFMTLSMVLLRFKDPSPREFKVPFNVRIGQVDVPIGLGFVFLVVFFSALANLLTKQVATVSGLIFTVAFLTVFMVTDYYNEKRRRGAKHEHREQFNQQVTEEVNMPSLGLSKPYRKLVSIRSPHNLHMLEKALAETDPEITDVMVMTAKVMAPRSEVATATLDLDTYDQKLMTAVVERAERAGKSVIPLIVTTNNPLHAILKASKDLQVQELVMGASNKFTAEEQLDQTAFYWISLHNGRPPGLTVRILSRDRDVSFDLEGGNRIPKLGERRARSVAELRAAGVGVDRLLLAHDGTPASSDLFKSVLTMIDPQVVLDLVAIASAEPSPSNGADAVQQDHELATHLGRELRVYPPDAELGPGLVNLARDGGYDLIILALPAEQPVGTVGPHAEWIDYVLQHAHCPVFLAAHPVIPKEIEQ